MAQIKKVSVRFIQTANEDKRYVDDRSRNRTTVYIPRVPFSLYSQTNQKLQTIYEAGGGVVSKIGGQLINAEADNSLCGESDNVTPRKLVFILSNGETLSVPVAKRDDLVSTANTVIGEIDAVDGLSVICIELEGEKIADLLLEFGGNFTGVPAQVANNSKWYTGITDYTTDTDQQISLAYKIASPDGEKPPNAVEDAWNACVGELTNTRGCGGRANRFSKRRYFAKYVVGDNTGGENIITGDATNEIPVKANSLSDIEDCGQSIVDTVEGALFCLPYKGHSDRLFHTVNDVDLG